MLVRLSNTPKKEGCENAACSNSINDKIQASRGRNKIKNSYERKRTNVFHGKLLGNWDFKYMASVPWALHHLSEGYQCLTLCPEKSAVGNRKLHCRKSVAFQFYRSSYKYIFITGAYLLADYFVSFTRIMKMSHKPVGKKRQPDTSRHEIPARKNRPNPIHPMITELGTSWRLGRYLGREKPGNTRGRVGSQPSVGRESPQHW